MDCDRCLLTKFELIQSLVDIKEHAALCKAPLQRDLNKLMLFLEGVFMGRRTGQYYKHYLYVLNSYLT